MSHFAKHHYEAIATVIQASYRYAETDNQRRGVERCMNGMADLFKSDNLAFDRSRFLHACKPGSNVKARTAHLA